MASDDIASPTVRTHAIPERSELLIMALALGMMVCSWIALVPPSAGPDEASHVVRGAALVRGQVSGQEGLWQYDYFELPAWIGFPDPGCYAFQPYTPASCATTIPRPVGSELVGTRATTYPIWGHLLPGLATLSPVPGSVSPLARALSAAIPMALIAWALFISVRSGPLRVAGMLLSLTPMAWFTLAVVNPSATVIAGGIALWIAGSSVGIERSAAWLAALGWSAMVLPRRDGIVWACLALVILCLLHRQPVIDWFRALGGAPRALVAVSTLTAVGWALMDGSLVNRASVLGLALLAAVSAWQVVRYRPDAGLARRVTTAVIAGLLLSASTVAVFLTRPNSFDSDSFVLMVGRTGERLSGAIGLLGWLDTPVPLSMQFLWLVALGMMAAAALTSPQPREVWFAGATVGVAIAMSWLMEIYSGTTTGTYWQGRYYLPLLVGVPIVLGRASTMALLEVRVARLVGSIAMVVLNLALLAAVRRWAVGIGGSMNPWDWNTYRTLTHPLLFILVHATASIVLLARSLRTAERTAALETERTRAIAALPS
jgi:hypothetical protein